MILNHNWTKEELKILVKQYPQRGKEWCCKKLNKSEASVRAKAASLKLRIDKNSTFFKEFQSRAATSKIGKKRPEQAKVIFALHKAGKLEKTPEHRKAMSIARKKLFAEGYVHPRGMLGKKHTNECLDVLSQRSKDMWKDPNAKVNSKETRLKKSQSSAKMMVERIKNKGSIYSRANNGWYIVGERKFFFRSSWEVVYARYLEWLVAKKEIVSWDYEVDTFWFDGEKRGVTNYTPDFKLLNKNGSVEFHEVKGYMDDKSKTKIARMKKYHPNIKLLVIAKDEYKEVAKFERMFPDAEKIEK